MYLVYKWKVATILSTNKSFMCSKYWVITGWCRSVWLWVRDTVLNTILHISIRVVCCEMKLLSLGSKYLEREIDAEMTKADSGSDWINMTTCLEVLHCGAWSLTINRWPHRKRSVFARRWRWTMVIKQCIT